MPPITTRLGRARWMVLGIAMVTLLAACGNDDDSNDASPGAGTTLNVLAGIAISRTSNIAVLAYLPESVSIGAGATGGMADSRARAPLGDVPAAGPDRWSRSPRRSASSPLRPPVPTTGSPSSARASCRRERSPLRPSG